MVNMLLIPIKLALPLEIQRLKCSLLLFHSDKTRCSMFRNRMQKTNAILDEGDAVIFKLFLVEVLRLSVPQAM